MSRHVKQVVWFSGAQARTVITLKPTDGSVLDVSGASSITAVLVAPNGSLVSSAPATATSSQAGAAWAQGKIVVVFDAAETVNWADNEGLGNYLQIKTVIGTVPTTYETPKFIEIKEGKL